MPSYTQANQPLAIKTPLGADKLLLARLVGTEAISRLYHFQLDCLAPEPISFDDLLGKPATVRLTVPGCPQRYVNGIVCAMEEGNQSQGPAGAAAFYRYRVELVPRLWLCGLRRQSRVFQDKAVPDILQTVLRDDWGLAVRSRLTGSYPARDYCVQYRETDLAFARRLMEEEGICFYFEHTENSHTLVLADGPDGHPDLPGQSRLPFDRASGGRRAEGRVYSWAKRQSIRPCKVTLRDHCFQLPESSLQASSAIPESVPAGARQHRLKHSVMRGGNEMLEDYDHLGGYSWRFDGVSPEGSDQPQKVQGLYQENQRVADLRAGAEATQALAMEGQSLCGHLLPGAKFTLEGHFDGDGSYLLTGVEHQADLEAAYLPDPAGAGRLYENRFRAAPSALPFRPPLETPPPRAYGVLTALVVGPKGGDIFVDRYGRVKVKFFWDREEATGPQNSCWLRVGQLWAGNRWGAFFWPRVGHEVIVSFLDGNPDRPIITGSVYNENHMPPFELPANKTLAGIKSNTSSGGGAASDPLQNYSGWLINDEAGKEHIEIHGEKHIAFFSEQTQRQMVDGAHRHNVNGVHSLHVGALPGGSGSGGGLDPDNPHPYQYSGYTSGGKIGVALTSTCGANLSGILGLYGTLTVGDYMNFVVNPLGMVADLGMTIPGTGMLTGLASGGIVGLASPAMGYTNITMGSQTQLAYGTNVTVSRGAKAAISEAGLWNGGQMETGEAVFAGLTFAAMTLTSAFSTAGMIAASYDSYNTNQEMWTAFLATAGALAGALEVAEVARATYNQVAKAKEAAEAAGVLLEEARTVEGIADLVTSLFGMDPLNFNTCRLIKGNSVEYSDASRMIGADSSLMLYAGETSGEQAAAVLTPTQMSWNVGMPLSGPRMALSSEDEEINIAVGPVGVGAQVTLNPTQMGLSTGMPAEGASIVLNEAGITLQAGPCKIVLTVEGTIQLVTPAATLSLAEGVATLTGNEETTITGSSALQFIGENCVIGVTNLTSTAIMQIE
jgi:type VI secretion system secreted protein VgrG